MSQTPVTTTTILNLKGKSINPYVTNGLSHPYHLDEPIFVLRDISGNFSILFHFSMKFMSANRIVTDGMPRFTEWNIHQAKRDGEFLFC